MTTHWDVSKIRARVGQAYILPYPETVPVNAYGNPVDLIDEYFSYFYSDGEARQVLLPGLMPWAYIGAKGLILDPKYKETPFPLANGLAVDGGKWLESLIGEMDIGDVSSSKLAEMLSATPNEILDVETSSDLYSDVSKLGVMLGSQPYNNRFMLMYRWPSVNPDGTIAVTLWDHLLLSRVYFDVSPKLDFTQTKCQSYTVKVCAEDDLYLINPDTGLAVAGYLEELETISEGSLFSVTVSAGGPESISGNSIAFIQFGYGTDYPQNPYTVTFSVNITRDHGYNYTIDASIPGPGDGITNWTGDINGVPLDGSADVVATLVPDSFTINMSGYLTDAWGNGASPYVSGGVVVSCIGSDATAVQSNRFMVIITQWNCPETYTVTGPTTLHVLTVSAYVYTLEPVTYYWEIAPGIMEDGESVIIATDPTLPSVDLDLTLGGNNYGRSIFALYCTITVDGISTTLSQIVSLSGAS